MYASRTPSPPPRRDRADERRKGVNADYEDAEADLLARGIRPDGLNQLTIEESKFLGGDAAHTHLVKGLDYALLQQVAGVWALGGEAGWGVMWGGGRAVCVYVCAGVQGGLGGDGVPARWGGGHDRRQGAACALHARLPL